MKKILVLLLIILAIPLVLADTPEITSSPVTQATLNMEYVYEVELNNYNESLYEPRFALNQSPSGMSINDESGRITWIPTSEGTFAMQVTVYNESDFANLNNSLDEQSFDIVVTESSPSIEATALRMGSSTQERDETTTESYTIKNTGSYDMDVEVTNNLHSRYEFSLSQTQFTLSPGEERSLTANTLVPLNQQAGEQRLGRLTMNWESNNEQGTANRDVFLEARNNLLVEEIEVRVDGRRDRMSGPGLIDRVAQVDSSIEMVVELLNDGLMDIEDIEVELISADIRDADGELQTIRRLREGRTDNARFSFELNPEDIDFFDEIFEIEVVVIGEDEEGARHGETWLLELEIERETRDVRITNVEARPSTLSCENTVFTLETRIVNVGERDLSDAMVLSEIPTLDVSEFQRNIRLDVGETSIARIDMEIPEDARVGTHFLDVFAHPRATDDRTDLDTIEITVLECPTDEDDNDVEEPVERPPVVIGEPVERPAESSFLEDNYVLLLAGMVVILFVMLITMIVSLTRK